MDLSSIALQGLQQADDRLQQASTRLASVGSDGDVDTVSISAEMVALLSAKNEYMTNVRALKTGDEVQQAALDIMA
jgi:flagellar hook protein FlgE